MTKMPRNYAVFELEAVLKERLRQKLSPFGIKFFQYIKCKFDGQYTYLSTDVRALQHYMDAYDMRPIIPSFFPENLVHQTKYMYLVDDFRSAQSIRMGQSLNIYHSLSMVFRSYDKYEHFVVALPEYREHSASFYLSILSQLENLFFTFKEDNKDLIEAVDRSKFYVDKAKIPQMHEKLLLQQNKIDFVYQGKEVYLTTQEFRCLEFLKAGMSNKRVAALLEISSRSVETYVSRIKDRIGATSRSQLERIVLREC